MSDDSYDVGYPFTHPDSPDVIITNAEIRADAILERMEAEYRECADATADPVGYAFTPEGRKKLAHLAARRVQVALGLRRRKLAALE